MSVPELPEVETIVRDLRKRLVGSRIMDVTVHDARIVKFSGIEEFRKRLTGRTVNAVERRGKAIVIALDEGKGFFIVQLMMTGQLIFSAAGEPGRDTKITFRLSSGEYLFYNDYRIFGKLQVVERCEDVVYFRQVGPEPLGKEFTVDWLAGAVQNRTVAIKTLLMNHTFLAGIGNIYASEILFQSGIHPRRKARSLKRDELVRLHGATVGILKEAIRFRGTSMNTYRDSRGEKGNFINRVRVYGREDEECPRCRTVVARMVLNGRSTFYCKRCQH